MVGKPSSVPLNVSSPGRPRRVESGEPIPGESPESRFLGSDFGGSLEAGRRPVGGRGQEVSADWKCPTDGFQVTTIRRALERGANESLRWVAGRRGWERCESGRSNRVKTEPETRSPARDELGSSSRMAGSSLNGAKVKVVGLRRPSGQHGFVARSLDCRQKAFAQAEVFWCVLGLQGVPSALNVTSPWCLAKG